MLHCQKNKLKKSIQGDDYLGVRSAVGGYIKLATFATPKTDLTSPRSNSFFPEPEGEGYRGN